MGVPRYFRHRGGSGLKATIGVSLVTQEARMSSIHAPRVAALTLALSVALGSLVPAPAMAASPAKVAVDIPYETFTLPNGLRVVVHTDRKAPIVAVNVWYHVGSKLSLIHI